MNFYFYLILIFLINKIVCNTPVAPLTQLRTIHECHQKSSSLTIDCNIGHRIRILESFYGVAANQDRDYCEEGYREKDCKSYTSFQNACNGRSSCTVHFFRVFLPDCNANSNYLTVQYECVPENKVHGVCTNIEDISTWGTLRTTDFPQPYGSNEDCWCKLSADNNQRIVLSVISFQLFPYDPTCSETGLYLQSDRKRSKECTFLQQDHYYISSSKNLYLNFYSREPVVRAGFWIIYEASDAKSRIRLKCGDTDEVRPADFTRFSTKKELILTPYIYELASSTTPSITTTTEELTTTPTTTRKQTTILRTFNLSRRPKYNTTLLLASRFHTSRFTSTRTTTTTTSTSTTTTSTTTRRTRSTTKRSTTTTTTTTTFTIKTSTTSTLTVPTTTTGFKGTWYLGSEIGESTVNEFIITTTPPIMITNVSISKKISFNDERKNSTLNDYSLVNKSEILNQTETVVAFGLQEKKSFEKMPKIQNRKLSKTELTIVISCVVFIALLTIINLLIYTFKKLAKKPVNTTKIIETNLTGDPGKKSYDILPGVGEIVLWADNDKRGYLIDINGSWAKIDGQRWIRDNMAVLHNTYKKASMAYRNKFKKKEDKANKELKDESRLIKRIPPTSGNYVLATVPEAIEYENSENASRSSIKEDYFSESDYHIEHGRVASFGKNSKILCQQASSIHYITENKLSTNPYNESNFYDQNETYEIENQNKDKNPEMESQTNILALSDTDSSPSLNQKIQDDNIIYRVNPNLIRDGFVDSNSSIRLDPSILKYSNQPIAIVAPSKSNSSTLEKKQIKKDQNEMQTISLRTINIQDSNGPIIEMIENNQQIHQKEQEEQKNIKMNYHNYKIRNSLNAIINEEFNYEITTSRTRLINESSRSTINENVPNETTVSNLDSNSSCQLIDSQTNITEHITKRQNTVEFSNDEHNFMSNKELRVDTEDDHRFTNAIKKACQIEDMISKNSYQPPSHHDDDLKHFISAIRANNEELKKMNDEQIYDALVKHIKKQDPKDDEENAVVMKNLHSVKSLKHFFEIRAKSNETETHLKDDDSKKMNSIERSVKHGLGVCSDLESDSKLSEITTECKTPVAPPLPEFLINQEEVKPKFSIKSKRSKTDSIYLYQQSNDLHDKLIREIHNKSLERSKKDSSLFFDEHGNLINKPSSSKGKNKMSKIKDLNSATSISEKINQLGMANQTKITSFRYNKNRSHSVDSKLDRGIDLDISSEIIDRQVQMIEMINGTKSGTKLNDLNQNMSFRSDFSRISNSSVVSSRSMLSEAKAKLEAFGKYSKQSKSDLKKHDNLEASFELDRIENEYLQTKF